MGMGLGIGTNPCTNPSVLFLSSSNCVAPLSLLMNSLWLSPEETAIFLHQF